MYQQQNVTTCGAKVNNVPLYRPTDKIQASTTRLYQWLYSTNTQLYLSVVKNNEELKMKTKTMAMTSVFKFMM